MPGLQENYRKPSQEKESESVVLSRLLSDINKNKKEVAPKMVLDDIELVDFRADIEREIVAQLFRLRGMEVGEISPVEQEKINDIASMAMLMHEEDRRVAPKNLAQVAVQEYFEGNDGSKSWLLKGK